MTGDTKKLKKEVIILIIILIVVGISVLAYFVNGYMETRRIRFMTPYIGETASGLVIKYSEYWGNDWLKSFTTLMSESEGNPKACNTFYRKGVKHHARGFYQIAGMTSAHWRTRVPGFIKDTDPYAIEFNIWAGNGEIATWRRHYNGDWYKAVAIYNVGYGDFVYRGKRNAKHVEKWARYYEKFNAEYRRFF